MPREGFSSSPTTAGPVSRAYRACRLKRLLFLEKLSNCSYGRRRNRSSEETLTAFYLPVGLRPSLSRPFFCRYYPRLLIAAIMAVASISMVVAPRVVHQRAGFQLRSPKRGDRRPGRTSDAENSQFALSIPTHRTSKPLFNNRGLCTRHLIDRATIRRITSLRILVEVKSRPTQLRLVEDFAPGDPGIGQARRESL